MGVITPHVDARKPGTPGESPSTTTLAVVDRDGNMVTLTQTLSDFFYRGDLAARIAEEMAAHGGTMNLEDLAGYRVVEREPVRGRYRGREILSAPPPVGGLALVETLQVLDQLELRPHAPD